MRLNHKTISTLFVLLLFLFPASFVQAGEASHRTADGKLKVLYHIDGTDVGTAKYAMKLIQKHMEAEGGPDKIDIKVVVHGPALHLFEKENIDPALLKGLTAVVKKGVEPEMCQVSMKLFKRPLDTLAPGFKGTEHPVAVKRIADLQEQGYVYIKP